jgi:hypothetical protein
LEGEERLSASTNASTVIFPSGLFLSATPTLKTMYALSRPASKPDLADKRGSWRAQSDGKSFVQLQVFASRGWPKGHFSYIRFTCRPRWRGPWTRLAAPESPPGKPNYRPTNTLEDSSPPYRNIQKKNPSHRLQIEQKAHLQICVILQNCKKFQLPFREIRVGDEQG